MTARFFRLVPLLCLFSTFSSSLFGQSAPAEADAIFESWSKPDGPGLAVAVMKAGKVVYRKGFGAANLEYDLPITPETVFHAASLSKQFTAFSILQLAAAGKLSIEDDVRKYIPELQDYGEVVRIKHMLTHTSGLRDQWRLLALAGWAREDVVRNSVILDLAARQRGLNFTPGDRHMYSNLGYTLLAEIVARVSGQTFAAYTQQHIFTPLGMSKSQFYDDYHKIVKDRAYSYGNDDGEVVKRPLNLSTVGATSLFTTVDDLLIWAQNFSTLKIGNEQIIKQMNEGAVLNSGLEIGVTPGQFKGSYLGKPVILHAGSDAGFRCYLLRFPDEDINIALLGNSSQVDAETLVFTLAHHFFDPPEKEENAGSSAAKKRYYSYDESIFTTVPKATLESFVGKYWATAEWYDREIRLTQEGLSYYRPNNGSSTLLRPISTTAFKMVEDTEDVTVRFENRSGGRRAMILKINDDPELEYLAYTDFGLSEYVGNYYSDELAVTYRIIEKDDTLVLYTLRKGEVRLKPITKDYFTCQDRNYKKVTFRRDESRNIVGFTVANGGITGIDFERN